MTGKQAPPRGPGGEGSDRRSAKIALAVAVPLSAFLAGVLCLATVIALTTLVTRTAGPGPGEGAGAPAAESEEPAPDEGTGADPDEDEGSGTEPAAPKARATDEGVSGVTGQTVPEVPPGSYDGTSTWLGDLRVECETAYTDTTITDGLGTSQAAPAGSEFHIYRLHVTNEGEAPAFFDTMGTTATTTDGMEFTNDEEAEWTVAWDYFWEDINPGQTVTTYVVLTAAEGTQFAEVRIAGSAVLQPRT